VEGDKGQQSYTVDNCSKLVQHEEESEISSFGEEVQQKKKLAQTQCSYRKTTTTTTTF